MFPETQLQYAKIAYLHQKPRTPVYWQRDTLGRRVGYVPLCAYAPKMQTDTASIYALCALVSGGVQMMEQRLNKPVCYFMQWLSISCGISS
jgi:hypothetical protein